MEEKNLIITLIIAISVVIVLVLSLVFASMGSKTKKQKAIKKVKEIQAKKKKSTIEELVELAANRKATKNDLTNAVLKVAKELPIPKKTKGRMPKEAKIYLNFVLLVASHKQADAKLIAFMNTELKKHNDEYSTEIDVYENEGLRQRANRI